jgi:hypothetical protein
MTTFGANRQRIGVREGERKLRNGTKNSLFSFLTTPQFTVPAACSPSVHRGGGFECSKTAPRNSSLIVLLKSNMDLGMPIAMNVGTRNFGLGAAAIRFSLAIVTQAQRIATCQRCGLDGHVESIFRSTRLPGYWRFFSRSPPPYGSAPESGRWMRSRCP